LHLIIIEEPVAFAELLASVLDVFAVANLHTKVERTMNDNDYYYTS